MPRSLLAVLAALTTVLALGAPSHARLVTGIEDYASYQPQTRCAPKAKPGTVAMGRWIVKRYGGRFGGISRDCKVGGASEHKEGRAFDWMIDADRKADRTRARKFLQRLRETDRHDNTDALARRMGVMYVIWNDQMYAAWREFAAEPYLSSSCRSKKRCSKTLRHRDHLHISLSRRGGRGLTSWYDGRLD